MSGIVDVPGFALRLGTEQRARALELVATVLERGVLSLGPLTEEFERAFATHFGFAHAVAVSSGTTALQIGLTDLGVAGGVVLCPANTNFGTAAAIVAAGARVRLYDSGLYPDAVDLRRRLAEPDVRAAIVVHIGGYCSPDLPELIRLCDDAGVPVVEDCAHAHGSAVGGIPAGRWGRVGAFSFFPTKPITTGEGGMLVTDDDPMALRARRYRNQGKDEHGAHVLPGNSWRLPELSAALGLAQMPEAEADRERREENAREYDAALAGSACVPAARWADHRYSHHKYVVECAGAPARDAALDRLSRAGVAEAGPVYREPIFRLPVFADLDSGAFPMATAFSDGHFCVPLWTRMPDETARRVTEALRDLR